MDYPIRNYVPTQPANKAKVDPYSFKFTPYEPKLKAWEMRPAKTYDTIVPKAVQVRKPGPVKPYVYKEYIPPWERGKEKKRRERLPPVKKDDKKPTRGKSVRIAPVEETEPEPRPQQPQKKISAVGSVKRTMMLFYV